MFQAGFLDKGIGGRGVVLTDAALSKIQVVCCLQNPMPVCSIQASKITDYDLMELLLALDMEDVASKKSQRRVVPQAARAFGVVQPVSCHKQRILAVLA